MELSLASRQEPVPAGVSRTDARRAATATVVEDDSHSTIVGMHRDTARANGIAADCSPSGNHAVIVLANMRLRLGSDSSLAAHAGVLRSAAVVVDATCSVGNNHYFANAV